MRTLRHPCVLGVTAIGALALALALLPCITHKRPGTDGPGSQSQYTWPSRHDYLEDLYALRSGYYHNVFSAETTPCSFGETSLGRQNAAEWIRLAFHDAIGHDASQGVGGLDASIAFELGRHDHVDTRAAFETTLYFMDLFHTSRSSIADLIALGVYVSVANCGGPRIPLRVGRQDADGPGFLPAPMVHEDLETHKAIFVRAGFTAPQDMVTLVACGHTLGGVHPTNFPSVVGPETAPRRRVVPFEQAPGSSFLFDNRIVLEYLSGTGANPLVHGHNDTTNSDKRIFGADGDATMRALADPGVFEARCADLFSHMLNLVPRHVASESSRPLRPIDVKPYIREQSLRSDGNIHLHGRIRVRVGGSSSRSGHDVRVRLGFKDRTGRPTKTVEAMRAKRAGGLSQGHFGDEFVWFEFAVAVPSVSGLSSFNVVLINSSDDTSELFENGGRGFPVPDTLLYQVRQSCLNSTVKDDYMQLRVVAAVRRGQEAIPPPTLRLDLKSPREGSAVKMIQSVSIPFQYSGVEQHGYSFYSVDTPVPLSSWNTRFDITTDSGATVEFKPTNILRSSNACRGFL